VRVFNEMSTSPTAEGFKLIFRRPAIALAEIAWRWSFAAAACFLVVLFLIAYADSLPVNALDRILLGTQQPILVLRAIQRIFHGSAFRFVEAGTVLAIALTVAWIALASFGRATTLKALLEHFGVDSNKPNRGVLSSLLALNSLRAVTTLAAAVGALGAVLLASSVWASTRISAADATRLCVAVLFLTWIVWDALNWLLSTAAVFVVGDRNGALDAMARTVRLCQELPGPFVAVGIWFGLAHLGAFIAACGFGFTVLGAIGTLPAAPILFVEFLIFLGYCAVADLLYTARLAAYAAIIHGGETLKSNDPSSAPPRAPSAVDASELILSDVPLPAI
jgi:hypothetical protein